MPDVAQRNTIVKRGKRNGMNFYQLYHSDSYLREMEADQDKLDRLVAAYPRLLTSAPEDIHARPVDIYCPCALGAVLNERTLPELRCKIVCGAANNQLADEHCGDRLAQTGILYAPDYLVNAGGMIAYAESRHPKAFTASVRWRTSRAFMTRWNESLP
jgi:leucine dehydrogenase